MTPPAAAAAPAPAVRPRRAPAPRRAPGPRGPRRVSGPSRPSRPATTARPTRSRGAAQANALPLAVVSAFEALAQHRLLDRLADRRSPSGRTWIGIVAFALIGIVTLQLGLLKLNGGIGHAIEREALLQRQNAALSIENSEMASGLRVETRAAQLGMAFAPTGQLRFLGSRPYEDVAKAAAALTSAARAAAARAAEGSASTTTSTSTSGEASASSSGEAGSGASPSFGSGESSSSHGGESSAGESTGAESAGATSAGATSVGASTHEAESSSGSSGEAQVGGGETAPSGGTQPSAGG